MNEKEMKEIHDYKILKSAYRIVEDLKTDNLFGDSKECFLYATLSEGLAILIRQINEQRKNKK